MDASTAISRGETALGIEFGSTRIKAVLIGPDNSPLATGGHEWKSSFVDGVWTYSLDDVWAGVQAAYADLAANVQERHGVTLQTVGALGVSAMMHGYLAFNADGELLVPFRTWQNTITGEAAGVLTQLFQHNIPQRWSVAHLYQAVLGGEEHVTDIDYLVTLAGYVHWRLTGERALGVGDASGMFPIDPATGTYDEGMLGQFDELVADKGYPWRLADLLPRVLPAGAAAGTLTDEGARLLDPTGQLQPGVAVAPPEGDAGTGMVATNSVARRTANVSAGTSIFAMVVLEGQLKALHEEIDLVTTPAGDLVAMAHCNNGTIDLSAWVSLFGEVATAVGATIGMNELFEALYTAALDGDPDGGGMLAYNYLAGEHVTGLEAGRPLFVRTPSSSFTLANFMRTQLFASLGALRVGMDVLLKDEGVQLDSMFAHGGLFKTKGVAQRFLAGAMNTPVSVGEVAGEGGAWGMALLAKFVGQGQDLAGWLGAEVFARADVSTVEPDPDDVTGFDQFMERYRAGLAIERAAVDALR
ncbi:xylulokinase [Tessaracoccus flavus]|uniref:ATPase n=1 Tax=Tessaracoccus flavus TaxID=1610493 RepID=A0A1Q2CBM8_9ACTN|nr:FGGY-family carbohydrate kinase [Tessaracoccus flavus]AQP43508.1 ATPase [Tessaracoccus flavus]SDY85609.1 Sugar (pentulose or hexulose) kinase [Tessaracoccus flavus]